MQSLDVVFVATPRLGTSLTRLDSLNHPAATQPHLELWQGNVFPVLRLQGILLYKWRDKDYMIRSCVVGWVTQKWVGVKGYAVLVMVECLS